jgi:DNA-binding response OmpR family regulator
MNLNDSIILFVDNSVNRIFKTIEAVKSKYKEVHVFSQEQEFLDYMQHHHADLIFLNLDLQPNDAVVLLKEIKKQGLESQPFIVIFSDKQDDFVQEFAFNAGADAFINFHGKSAIMELFIRNLLRRKVASKNTSKRAVFMDHDSFLIFKNGESFQLPRKEYKLFELLYNNPDTFFSKTEIALKIWKDEAIARKRTIDVHIYNIRRFFGKRIIQSQKGRGYRMNKKVLGVSA